MKRSRPQCFLACVLSSFLFSPGALADGIYIGETAYKVPPSIPGQRAILVYRDGMEKLIIESALEAEGTQFGWIIPVPAQPTRFEKTSPGVLKTLSLAIGPRVVHEMRGLRFFAFVILFIVALWSIIIILWKLKNPDRLFIRILLYTLFLLLIFSTFMHHLGVDIGMDYDVAVKDVQQVGSYEIAVLDANSPEGLNRWLQSNGFVTLNEDESSVVTDYITEGWYFVAAKLQRQGGGYSEPHPVAITFRANKPVYPMRLTAFATDELYLEIIVISDRMAMTPRLVLECSDTYCHKLEAARSFLYAKPLPAFVGRKFEQTIGHPDASQILWEDCVITKLVAVLQPAQMAEDLEFETLLASPHQKRYYSYTAAISTASSIGVLLWSFAMLVLTSQFYTRIKSRNGAVFYMLKLLLPVTLIVTLLALTVYVALEKTEVQVMVGSPQYANLRRHIEMSRLYGDNFEDAEKRENLATASAAEFREFLTQHYADSEVRNRYTGERIMEEDSPGNYTIFEDKRGVVWRSYTSEGFPVDLVLAEEFE